VGSLGRGEGIFLYLGKCMKLGVCVFCSLFDLGNNLSFFLALMEYHCSDDRTVASRIFERGLDFFSDEIDYYVLRQLFFATLVS
jgi:hypothetical protein